MNNKKFERLQLTKKDLCTIFEVKSINSIEKRGQLYEKLIQKNCRLIKKIKNGRSIDYVVDVIPLENMTFDERLIFRKIKKEKQYVQHACNMSLLIKGQSTLVSKNQQAKAINVNKYQIDLYNNALIDEKFMKQSGFRYVKYKNGKFCEEVSKETYTKYWSDNSIAKKMLKNLYAEKSNFNISQCEYDAGVVAIYDGLLREEGEIIHRLPKHKEGSNFDKFITEINNWKNR